MVVTMPKNKTQNKTKSKNRKQTPNNNKTHKAQNRHCEQGQLSRRKVMAYASQQSHQYGFPRLQSVHHHIVKASFSSCSNFGERPYACSDNSLRARDPNIKALFFPSRSCLQRGLLKNIFQVLDALLCTHQNGRGQIPLPKLCTLSKHRTLLSICCKLPACQCEYKFHGIL